MRSVSDFCTAVAPTYDVSTSVLFGIHQLSASRSAQKAYVVDLPLEACYPIEMSIFLCTPLLPPRALAFQPWAAPLLTVPSY